MSGKKTARRLPIVEAANSKYTIPERESTDRKRVLVNGQREDYMLIQGNATRVAVAAVARFVGEDLSLSLIARPGTSFTQI